MSGGVPFPFRRKQSQQVAKLRITWGHSIPVKGGGLSTGHHPILQIRKSPFPISARVLLILITYFL